MSANTRRAYSTALQRLDAALDGRPLTDSHLAEYVTGLQAAGRAPASVALVLAAVRFRARRQEVAAPVGPLTDRALAGLRREGRKRGRGQVQVQGVTFAAADAAAALAADAGDAAGLRDAALIAVASDALLRVSEVAALDVADITAEDDDSGRLTIRASKTDPEGDGAVLYLGAPTVRRVRGWLDIAGHVDGPLFRSLRRGGHVQPRRLTPNAIRLIIRRRAAAAGIEGNVSGHSLRIGGAQSLAAAGASLVELQTAGRLGGGPRPPCPATTPGGHSPPAAPSLASDTDSSRLDPNLHSLRKPISLSSLLEEARKPTLAFQWIPRRRGTRSRAP